MTSTDMRDQPWSGRQKLILLLILFVGLLIRLYVLLTSLREVNSDEAIVGLMARHILEGRWPFFYYGQSYYGPLDAYLTAPVFFLFGSSSAALRVVPLLASLLFILAVAQLGKELSSPKTGLLSAVFAGISPFFLTLRGLQSDAAYALLLLFGTLSFELYVVYLKSPSRSRLLYLAVVCLVGLWVFPLMIIYIIAIGLDWLLGIATRAKGYSGRNNPSAKSKRYAIRTAFLASLALLIMVTGRFLNLSHFRNLIGTLSQLATVSIPVFFGLAAPAYSRDYFVKLFTAYPAWAQWVILLVGWGLFLFGAIHAVRRFSKGDTLLPVFFSSFLLFSLIAFSWYPVNPDVLSAPRYFFPLYSLIPLWADAFLNAFANKPRLQMALLFVAVSAGLFGNIYFSPPSPVSPSLADWMASQGEKQYVYTEYAIGYSLAFESQERVIPFIISGNRPGRNRYVPYQQQVQRAGSPIFVYFSGNPDEKEFSAFLEQHHLDYQLDKVGAFSIYSKVSKLVTVTDDGLVLAEAQAGIE